MKQHKSINSYLDNLIQESIKSTLQNNYIKEEEKQGQEAGDSSAKTLHDKEKEKLKKGEVTVDDVIEKLNSIRSGKSFKDEAIKSSLEEYFNDLSKAEQVALLAYLKGISQVISGEIPGARAVDPADKEPGISMKKKNEPKTIKLKPVVIKAPEIKKSKSKTSSEDSTGPAPITPKR